MSQVGSILSNDGALAALNSLRTSSDTTNTLESELSSGKSINSPADNPAGYITAQGFTSQVNGLTQALSNANQGIALLQTAQGAIGQETDIVQQLNSIAVQASNGTQTPAESQSLQGVVSQLTSQVNTIAGQTQFNNINLLDGTFSGVDFQVGANNGQTISLSIASADASSIGMQASSITPAGMFVGTGTSVYSASAGAFTAGNLVIDGSNGQSTVAVSGATESASAVAAAVNADTATTNVAAQATNSVNFTATGTNFSFTLSNGTTTATQNAASISADSAQGLVDAINGHTATNGISAQLESNGSITLTQSSGDNIVITNDTAGTLTDSNANATVGSSTTPTAALYQGVVQLQSDSGFSIDGTSTANIGVSGASSLQSLANINVSTASGAQTAINVIKYALQGLGAQGGQLGAVQQRLQANVNNNETTQQNLTSALSVVQDANIPQVSEQLTQQQVLQAAGIASLKNSTALEQMYGQLLP